MLYVNFLITTVCLWGIVWLNSCYLRPALKNKGRFKLYRLRDELSLLAMRGKIAEDSEAYRLLLGLINNAIYATGSFRVSEFMVYVVGLHENPELKRRVQGIVENLAVADNPEYRSIACAYFATMHKIFRKDTRLLMGILSAIVFFYGILSRLNLVQKPSRFNIQKRQIHQVKKDFDFFSSQFGENMAA